MAPNLLFAVVWAGGATAVIAQAHGEEARLVQALGKPYQDYMLNTGRFFPLWF